MGLTVFVECATPLAVRFHPGERLRLQQFVGAFGDEELWLLRDVEVVLREGDFRLTQRFAVRLRCAGAVRASKPNRGLTVNERRATCLLLRVPDGAFDGGLVVTVNWTNDVPAESVVPPFTIILRRY